MSNLVADQIVQRIKDLSVFNKVGRAIHVREIVNKPIAGDSQSWIIELLGSPEPSLRDIGMPIQKEAVLYAVVIGLKTTNDPTGEKSVKQLESLRLSVRQALFGWSPVKHDPIELAGNELLHSEAGTIYWVERFATNHLIDKDNLL